MVVGRFGTSILVTTVMHGATAISVTVQRRSWLMRTGYRRLMMLG